MSFTLNHRLIGYSVEKKGVFLVSKPVKTSLKVVSLELTGTIPMFQLATWTFFMECHSFSSLFLKNLFKELNRVFGMDSGVAPTHPFTLIN